MKYIPEALNMEIWYSAEKCNVEQFYWDLKFLEISDYFPFAETN